MRAYDLSASFVATARGRTSVGPPLPFMIIFVAVVIAVNDRRKLGVITDQGEDGTAGVDVDDRFMMYLRTNSGTAAIAMMVPTAANEAITD